VVVGARVSRSGNAMPSSGDLEGFSGPVAADAPGVNVSIDKMRP
jgi:cytochrome c-type biogenesis protein CcmH